MKLLIVCAVLLVGCIDVAREAEPVTPAWGSSYVDTDVSTSREGLSDDTATETAPDEGPDEGPSTQDTVLVDTAPGPDVSESDAQVPDTSAPTSDALGETTSDIASEATADAVGPDVQEDIPAETTPDVPIAPCGTCDAVNDFKCNGSGVETCTKGPDGCLNWEWSTCYDGDACTADVCNAAAGCFHIDQSLACTDGNACTTDSCSQDIGCMYITVVCDDGDACTDDACDLVAGCETPPVVCDDNTVCTTDSCDPSTGCKVAPVLCDDGDPCTIDSCVEAGGCQYIPMVCNDGDACTTETCEGGACVTTPVSCDDGNPCHLDPACSPSTGCTWTPADNCIAWVEDDVDTCSTNIPEAFSPAQDVPTFLDGEVVDFVFLVKVAPFGDLYPIANSSSLLTVELNCILDWMQAINTSNGGSDTTGWETVCHTVSTSQQIIEFQVSKSGPGIAFRIYDHSLLDPKTGVYHTTFEGAVSTTFPCDMYGYAWTWLDESYGGYIHLEWTLAAP